MQIQRPQRNAPLNSVESNQEAVLNNTLYQTPVSTGNEESYDGALREDVESALSEMEKKKIEFDLATGGNLSP